MSKTTLDVLFDRGILEAGDHSEIDRQVLVKETAITMDTIGAVDRGDHFRQCKITQRTRETGEVQYRVADRQYGLTTLVNHIVDQLIDRPFYSTISDLEYYWTIRSLDDRTLWGLRMPNVSKKR